ncbi:hypothetical protein LTR91_000143 [Friedmanniomyces endolithicus]|uniref:GCN5-related N-acetyltransferase Rv2170-like domain-containing protein n=1 Tax=Friedmanniomyces endolithicus TaxID=329885 RepID=A0AAN6R2T9_9PEZI|nr:hypothetical protein LTR57_000609 [Friedmanniomyces endolithicus]KAK1013993.1 hypothetical protein LTS01_000523 [Friedmanniomyces endolithicus]KAK1016125.1 hypothetical protein LTR91_000143 [Friedmanniomyces endolithicus]
MVIERRADPLSSGYSGLGLPSTSTMGLPRFVNNGIEICHSFPLTNQAGLQVVLAALDCLRPYLPASLPLCRRLQFGRFFEDSSFIISNLGRDSTPGCSLPLCSADGQDAREKMWVMAFVDRRCRPETEAWVFGVWEAEGGSLVAGSERQREAERLMRGVVDAMKSLPLLPSIHGPSDVPDGEQRDVVGYSANDYRAHAGNPEIMLWGAVHERTVPILLGLGVVALQFKAGMMPNHTFVFDVAEMPTPPPLPKGLIWGVLQPQHLALVRSRTQIPRQERTMADLPNLAIFPSKLATAAPIAWAFVGLDGSLTTLHVEPEWRGRGLAKAMTTKLFRECMDGFWEEGVRTKWAHGYVVVGNEASARMCRSLGGNAAWECYWLRVDLGKGYNMASGANRDASDECFKEIRAV